MRLIALQAENIKRLRTVSLTFADGVMVIGGRNDQGKSSCLDAIAMALGGKDLVPGKPLRKGETDGHATVVIGDNGVPLYTVTRKFTAKGTTSLTVEAADGSRPASPQTLLDGLLGRLSFDPLAFARMEPKRQMETLRQLVGQDTDALDEQIAVAVQERTIAGRDVSRIEGAIASMPWHPDAPEAEVDTAALLTVIEQAGEQARKQEQLRGQADARRGEVARLREFIDATTNDIAAWKQDIIALEEKIRGAENVIALRRTSIEESQRVADALGSRAEAIEVPDTAAIRKTLDEADAVNAQVRANAARRKTTDELRAAKDIHAAAERNLNALRDQRRKLIESCVFPVDGLSLDETGVQFGGIPFDQASASGKLRVSVAIGLAMNPRLKLLLIRDGSLLDDGNLELIATMAQNAGAQVLIERVGTDQHTSVVIEDGTASAVAR